MTDLGYRFERGVAWGLRSVRTWWRAVGVVLAVAFVAAGCGISQDDSSIRPAPPAETGQQETEAVGASALEEQSGLGPEGSAAPATSGDPLPPPPAAEPVPGEAAGPTISSRGFRPAEPVGTQDAVLKLSDFPTGWREVRGEGWPASLDEFCRGDQPDVVETDRAESGLFVLTRDTEHLVDSLIQIFATPEEAQAVLEAPRTGEEPAVADCEARWFRDLIRSSDYRVLGVDSGRLAFPLLGDQSLAYQAEIEIARKNLDKEVKPRWIAEWIRVRIGSSLVTLVFLGLDRAVDDDLKETLTTDVAARAAAIDAQPPSPGPEPDSG